MKKVLDRILHLVLNVRIVRPIYDPVLLDEIIYSQCCDGLPTKLTNNGKVINFSYDLPRQLS